MICTWRIYIAVVLFTCKCKSYAFIVIVNYNKGWSINMKKIISLILIIPTLLLVGCTKNNLQGQHIKNKEKN